MSANRQRLPPLQGGLPRSDRLIRLGVGVDFPVDDRLAVDVIGMLRCRNFCRFLLPRRILDRRDRYFGPRTGNYLKLKAKKIVKVLVYFKIKKYLFQYTAKNPI